MDIAEQIAEDRANLMEALQRMQEQYEELGRRIQQQAGGIQYADMILARVKEQRAGAPPVEPPPGDE